MIQTLLSALYTKILSWIQTVFNAIFGGWNWQILFSWLPQDIQTAAAAFILVCFAITLLRILRDLLPF